MDLRSVLSVTHNAREVGDLPTADGGKLASGIIFRADALAELTDEGLAAVEAARAGKPVDLVVSDMAPNLSGIHPVDQARSVGLADLALAFAGEHLQPGGDFAVKVFQGAGLAEFEGSMRERFDKVYLRKPKASRDRSREVFLVGKGFSGG